MPEYQKAVKDCQLKPSFAVLTFLTPNFLALTRLVPRCSFHWTKAPQLNPLNRHSILSQTTDICQVIFQQHFEYYKITVKVDGDNFSPPPHPLLPDHLAFIHFVVLASFKASF